MEKKKENYSFRDGLIDGIPIALGYLSVSFGFGILAVEKGLSVLMAVMMSLMNLTSAGQVAAVGVISALGTYIEMVAVEFVTNIRYAFMGLSLTQQFNRSITRKRKLLISFGVTDEVYAVASCKPHSVGKNYMYGIILLPYVSWALGTLLGAVAGNLLPDSIKKALGILLYGMFIAIIVPVAKKDKGVIFAVISACALSCAMRYIPGLSLIPSGFAMIISSIAAACLAAYFFPKERASKNE